MPVEPFSFLFAGHLEVVPPAAWKALAGKWLRAKPQLVLLGTLSWRSWLHNLLVGGDGQAVMDLSVCPSTYLKDLYPSFPLSTITPKEAYNSQFMSTLRNLCPPGSFLVSTLIF